MHIRLPVNTNNFSERLLEVEQADLPAPKGRKWSVRIILPSALRWRSGRNTCESFQYSKKKLFIDLF